MSKSVFLKVSGSDFAAMEFQDNFNIDEFYKGMIAEGVTEKVVDNDDYYFEVEIYEFGEVDPEFESFVYDVLGDYDQQKACDYFRVV